jgi:lipoate-protein ligase B
VASRKPEPRRAHLPALVFSAPVRYREAVALQEALVTARLADAVPDTLLVMQHLPVVTLGRRARDQHLLVSPETLAGRGIDFQVAARGGDVTYHGPGQAVLYPVLKLGTREADAHGYLWNLEETALRTAADSGIAAFRREGKSGAWTQAGKLAAIGFKLRRWVSFHGMSFNVNVDLSGFETMVPCGLAGEHVVSLHTLLGASCPGMDEVYASLIRHFADVTDRHFQALPAGSYQGRPDIRTAVRACLSSGAANTRPCAG